MLKTYSPYDPLDPEVRLKIRLNICRPTVRCFYWLLVLLFKKSKYRNLNELCIVCNAFIHNRTGSLDLPSFYISTSIVCKWSIKPYFLDGCRRPAWSLNSDNGLYTYLISMQLQLNINISIELYVINLFYECINQKYIQPFINSFINSLCYVVE